MTAVETECTAPRWRRRWLVLAVLVAAVGLWAAGRRGSVTPLRLSTGTPGGTYHALGAQLARILSGVPALAGSTADPSNGSVDNRRRVAAGKANLGLSSRLALMTGPATPQVQVLGRLYRDVLQVVVRETPASRSWVRDPTRWAAQRARVYLGPKGSGTRLAAEQLLAGVSVGPEELVAVEAPSYSAVAALFGQTPPAIDAAVFLTGRSATAVTRALASGGRLVDLGPWLEQIQAVTGEGLVALELAPGSYPGQTSPVRTVAVETYLIASADLDSAVAEVVLEALYDHLDELLAAHATGGDIRLSEAFTDPPAGLELHPGAVAFRARERQTLHIAAGAPGGKYAQIGQQLALLLRPLGVPVRAVRTSGSVENVTLLDGSRPTVAIAQFDVALAARIGQTQAVYRSAVGRFGLLDHPQRHLRRIATLHEETLHVLVRPQLVERLRERRPELRDRSPTLGWLRGVPGLRICLGPDGGGGRPLAEALLVQHGIDPTAHGQSVLPTAEMVKRLLGDQLDVGFYLSHVPGAVLRTLVDDPRAVRLLSLDTHARSALVGPVFHPATIAAGTYACQPVDGPAIQTLGTRAVLLASRRLPAETARRVTRAAFEGAAYLGVKDGVSAMVRAMPSLPLHEGARAYFEDAGHLPSKRIDWLALATQALGFLVVAGGGYKGLVLFRRDRTQTAYVRRILAISIEEEEPHSSRRLLALRTEIDTRVRMPWWRFAGLDKQRWRNLQELIALRAEQAKDNLTGEMVAAIRGVLRDQSLDLTEAVERFDAMEQRCWDHFEEGEIDPPQHELLLRLLTTSRRDRPRQLAWPPAGGEVRRRTRAQRRRATTDRAERSSS